MKCIITSGYSTDSLWPLASDVNPKVIALDSDEFSVTNEIVKIVSDIVDAENVFKILNIKNYHDFQNKEFGFNIIWEPLPKNSAASVFACLSYIAGKKDDIVVIFPCGAEYDKIKDLKKSLKEAEKVAKKGFITFIGSDYDENSDTDFGIYAVQGKIGKSGLKISGEVSEGFEGDGKNLLVSSGIIVSKISLLKKVFENFEGFNTGNGENAAFVEYGKIKSDMYCDLPELPTEKVISSSGVEIAAVKTVSKFKTFSSPEKIINNAKTDKNGNIVSGNIIAESVKNSVVCSTENLVGVANAENLYICETEDAVLVCDKSRLDEISDITELISSGVVNLTPKTVMRPWGCYCGLNSSDYWLTRILTIFPGEKLSMHKHEKRNEHWTVLSGKLTVVFSGSAAELEKGSSIDAPAGVFHRIQNNSDYPVKVLEVQSGIYIGEDDMIPDDEIVEEAADEQTCETAEIAEAPEIPVNVENIEPVETAL